MGACGPGVPSQQLPGALQKRTQLRPMFVAIGNLSGQGQVPVIIPQSQRALPQTNALINEEIRDRRRLVRGAILAGGGLIITDQLLQALQLVFLQAIQLGQPAIQPK